MEKVIVVLKTDEADRKNFTDAAPGAQLTFMEPENVRAEDVADADAIIGNVDAALIGSAAKKLRWMQLQNAGTEGFCQKGVLPDGCALTNATGAYGMAISEHMVAMLFALQKRLDVYMAQQNARVWKRREHMFVACGSTVLIIGTGDLGTSFAAKMKAFGCHVIGVRRNERPKPDCIDEQYLRDSLDELLPRADVVALCLPGYDATRHMIGREQLRLMKNSAVLLNVGRGSAIDTDALVDALQAGEIYGAGLDVTDPEPLPAAHPLWGMEHVIITPHVSGLYALPQSLEKIKAIALDNLIRFERGEALCNVIDLETGYVKN